jgi:hypothetical protein
MVIDNLLGNLIEQYQLNLHEARVEYAYHHSTVTDLAKFLG